MKPTATRTHNQEVLEKMRLLQVTPAMVAQVKQATEKADGQKSLRSIQSKNARANYDMQRAGVDDLYARMGKSIECGEYDGARLVAINLQSALDRLNTAANRLADLS